MGQYNHDDACNAWHDDGGEGEELERNEQGKKIKKIRRLGGGFYPIRYSPSSKKKSRHESVYGLASCTKEVKVVWLASCLAAGIINKPRTNLVLMLVPPLTTLYKFIPRDRSKSLSGLWLQPTCMCMHRPV